MTDLERAHAALRECSARLERWRHKREQALEEIAAAQEEWDTARRSVAALELEHRGRSRAYDEALAAARAAGQAG